MAAVCPHSITNRTHPIIVLAKVPPRLAISPVVAIDVRTLFVASLTLMSCHATPVYKRARPILVAAVGVILWTFLDLLQIRLGRTLAPAVISPHAIIVCRHDSFRAGNRIVRGNEAILHQPVCGIEVACAVDHGDGASLRGQPWPVPAPLRHFNSLLRQSLQSPPFVRLRVLRGQLYPLSLRPYPFALIPSFKLPLA